MPLSRWAKAAMAAQSLVSIVTVALVVSRAVNILQLSPFLAVFVHTRRSA
jgi:hypothetical protein